MHRRLPAAVLCLLFLFAAACSNDTAGQPTPQAQGTTSAAATPRLRPEPTPTPTRTPTPSQSASALPTYGGRSIGWPRVARTTAAPAALGAVHTNARVDIVGGGTLAAGLTLPRLGGTASEPVVLTPCEHEVRISGPGLQRIAPSGPGDDVVVLDPGHGGHADGTLAADGTREADLTLALARQVQLALGTRAGRVVLTRTADIDTGLGYRVALADTLRADLSVSLHFDANPDTTLSRVPGMQVYGALSDPHGRRAAGVIYQAERRYVDSLSARVDGRWAARRNYGALYRRGSHGDYYYLLRNSHVPWVIAESLFLTAPREAALAKNPRVRRGLARAIATGINDYLGTHDPGSGWRSPHPQPPDPAAPGPAFTCHDPA